MVTRREPSVFVEERLICSAPVSTFSFDAEVVRVQTVAEDACGTLLKISGVEGSAWLAPTKSNSSKQAVHVPAIRKGKTREPSSVIKFARRRKSISQDRQA